MCYSHLFIVYIHLSIQTLVQPIIVTISEFLSVIAWSIILIMDFDLIVPRSLCNNNIALPRLWILFLWAEVVNLTMIYYNIYSQYVVSWNVTKFISLTSPCIYFFCKTWCWLSESLWFPFRSSVEINSFNNGNKSTHSGYQPRRSWKHRHENRVVPTGSLPSLWRFHQGRIRSGFR